MTIKKDCIDHVRRCYKFQVYSDKINVPLTLLLNVLSPWPFLIWGDVIGPINSKESNKHRFILVAIVFFKILVEVHFYAHVTHKMVKRFIEKVLIYWHSSIKTIVINNVINFNEKIIIELFKKMKVKHFNSSLYRPKMHGVVEVANKNIKKII